MLKLNSQGPQEIRKYPQAAAGHLKNIREKLYYKMLKLNPQEIREYPQAAAGHLKYIREKHFNKMLKLNPQEFRKYPQTDHLKDFTLTKYFEETLRELWVFLQNLW